MEKSGWFLAAFVGAQKTDDAEVCFALGKGFCMFACLWGLKGKFQGSAKEGSFKGFFG